MHLASAEAAQSKALTRFFDRHFRADQGAGKVLSIRAHSPEPLDSFQRNDLICLQTNRLLADGLERRGFRVCTEAGGQFDLCLIEATKYKDENLYHIALGWSSLRAGGNLILSAANALGGESLAKRIAAASLPLRGVWSLAKCRVIWLAKDAEGPFSGSLPAWLALGDYRLIPGTDLVTCPGIFSANAIDAGTRLLCETLPFPLKGRGADFGAGCGALSRHILSHSDQIRRLDLYDIERKALDAAERNLASLRHRCEIHLHWVDLPGSVSGQGFDWIVMNPPFHTGRNSVPALGKAFIETAAANLKADGTLWLVANRHLPYETVLTEHFGVVASICEKDGFKVCRGSHPAKPLK